MPRRVRDQLPPINRSMIAYVAAELRTEVRQRWQRQGIPALRNRRQHNPIPVPQQPKKPITTSGGGMTEQALTNGSPTAEQRVIQLEHAVAVLAWLHAELVYNLQVAAVTQALQNPQVQQALANQILQMQQGSISP